MDTSMAVTEFALSTERSAVSMLQAFQSNKKELENAINENRSAKS